MHKKILIIALSASCVFLSGCAPKIGGRDFSAHNIGDVSKTYRGVIISAHSINVSGSDVSKPGTGAMIGGVSGAVLGSTIGQGKGKLIGATLGGLATGAAGHFLEQSMTEQQGMEYQVQLENGSLVTVRQGADPVLAVGQKVFVTESSRGGSRVMPDNSR